MTLNELVKEAHGRAQAAGWWDAGKTKTALECHMLIVSEVAEATEEVRSKKPAFYVEGGRGREDTIRADDVAVILHDSPGAKPEGEAVELADALIRICDYAGFKGWDLEAIVKAKMDYNATRGYRHGGKAA